MKEIEIWRRFELKLSANFGGNPFTDCHLSAEFTNGKTTKYVRGFYDGNGIFIIRFMPQETGTWVYSTTSNVTELHGVTGSFLCTSAEPGNRGMVVTKNNVYFEYSDGTSYMPFGTTLYGWHFQDAERRKKTLQILSANCFNKVRMCVFPIWNYMYAKEYESYPFEVTRRTKIDPDNPSDSPDNYEVTFNFARFNPEYFQFLEECIAKLDSLGIETDLILFHPYDIRGLASMDEEQDFLYLEYIVARLASFKNVWWSMANEYDLADMCGMKPLSAWDNLAEKVYREDPNRHLLSIHNFYDPPIHKDTTSNWYDHTKPWITHLSIQTDNLFFVPKWISQYRKPVIIDECRYEGNTQYAWGNLTGKQMNDCFWRVVARGGFITHGESFVDGEEPKDAVWTFHGAKMQGESYKRMNYLRTLLELNGIRYLHAIATTGPHWDLYCGATEDENTVLIYFGDSQPGFEIFDFLPEDKIYTVELIDTWEMTSQKTELLVDNKLFFRVPNSDLYQAMLLKEVNSVNH